MNNIESKIKNTIIGLGITTLSFTSMNLNAQNNNSDQENTISYSKNIPAGIDTARCREFLKGYKTNLPTQQTAEILYPGNSINIKFQPGFYSGKIDYELNGVPASKEIKEGIIALWFASNNKIQTLYFTKEHKYACNIRDCGTLKAKDGDVLIHPLVLKQVE